jgi:hypothetical protein
VIKPLLQSLTWFDRDVVIFSHGPNILYFRAFQRWDPPCHKNFLFLLLTALVAVLRLTATYLIAILFHFLIYAQLSRRSFQECQIMYPIQPFFS